LLGDGRVEASVMSEDINVLSGNFAVEVGVNCLSPLHDIYSVLSCPLALKLLSFASVDVVS